MAQARRELLLRAHRHRLRKEDLEDCYSQATLELLAQARERGRKRVRDPRAHGECARAALRLAHLRPSPRAARAQSRTGGARHALPLGDGADGIEIADVRAEIERLVMLRLDLRSLGQVDTQS